MPILFERPTYEWVARVNQKHKQLTELSLSTEEKQALDRWLATEFVYSALRLEDQEFEREQVARLVSAPAGPAGASAPGATRLLDSLRTVTSMARERGKDSALSVELLLKLGDMRGTQDLATGGDSTSKVTPENLPLVLEGACQWFSADSFTELHPIEQAAIVFLRLIDLRPFAQRNDRTALVAASLFTLRSGLPPIIIGVEAQQTYRAALNEGVRMNTKPMVEFLAESVEQSLDLMILKAKKK
jgi:prophage maintenance system killer protein